MVCVFLLLRIYDQNYHMSYQQLNINSQLNIVRLIGARIYGNSNEDAKLEKGYNETNHKEEKPTVAGLFLS